MTQQRVWMSGEDGLLRQQAIQALESGAMGQGKVLPAALGEPMRLLEELRIHQAELEVQNGELQRTRLGAPPARPCRTTQLF